MTTLESQQLRLETRIDEIETIESWYETDPSVRVRFGAAFDAVTGAAASSTLYFEVPVGHRTPWHTHSAEEVVYVVEGTAEAGIGQRKLRVDAGGLALIPSGEPHGLENVGEQPLRFLGFFSSAAMVHVCDAPLQPFATPFITTPNAEQLPVPARSS